MTAVEIAEERPEPVYDSSLIRWARDASEAYKIASSLVKTSFVPQSMRNKPEEATATILTGAEVGLSPMASLRSIDIIQGTPAMRANTMRGLVQAQGHELWVEESTASRAVVCGRRRGESQVQQSVWTLDRARAMALLGKDNWKKQPQAMLVARATSECCRLIASDVLLGLPYSIEELSDDHDAPAADVTAEPAKKRTARRAPMVEPPPFDEPAAIEAPEPDAQTDVPDSEPEPSLETDGGWPEVATPGGES